MRNRCARAIAGVAALIVVASTACTTAGVAAAPGHSVPLDIVAAGADGGAQVMVRVRVGKLSSAVPVILDTGSSGLQIFADAVNTKPGSGVTVTSTRSGITYSGGHHFIGHVADATVTIGSLSTRNRIPVSLVLGAVCIPSKPTCPAQHGIPGFEQQGVFGILGIGLATSRGPVASPLLGMGALGNSWSIHLHGVSGTLVVGAAVPSPARRVATIAMRRTGTWNGHALWADAALDLCTTAGSVTACTGFPSSAYASPRARRSRSRSPARRARSGRSSRAPRDRSTSSSGATASRS
jgi:hypothetical protein